MGLKFGYYSLKKMFWNFFVVMDRVVDPVPAQQLIGIIAWGVRRFLPFAPRRRCLVSGGTKYGEKQAQIGLRLPDSGPELPYKTIRFRNVKISALISPRLPKYGWNRLEKRGSPRPLKSRLVFPSGLPV